MNIEQGQMVEELWGADENWAQSYKISISETLNTCYKGGAAAIWRQRNAVLNPTNDNRGDLPPSGQKYCKDMLVLCCRMLNDLLLRWGKV